MHLARRLSLPFEQLTDGSMIIARFNVVFRDCTESILVRRSAFALGFGDDRSTRSVLEYEWKQGIPTWQ